MKSFLKFNSIQIIASILFLYLIGMETSLVSAAESAAEGFDGRHLVVLYQFEKDSGGIVKDVSNSGQPVILEIADLKAVSYSEHSLQVKKNTVIKGGQASKKINSAIKRSGELTVEFWLTPADLNLKGPARIFTLSKNSSERNLTIGQELDKFEIRLRSTKTSTNGIPSLSSKSQAVTKKKTHLVYTRGRNGQARIYINGRLNQEGKVEGDLSNWNAEFEFALGNELTNDRPWLGTYHRVALFDRAFSSSQVLASFKAGSSGNISNLEPLVIKSPEEEFFESKVANILVEHCFECHDSATREGSLNLSRKLAAFKGGESGVAIVAGHADQSLLWKSISENEMPADREPLSDSEKEIIKKWINDGAAWSLDQIDPEVYKNQGQVAGNWIRRLTIPEYIETVRVSLGVDIAQEALEMLPPDLRADGFSNTAYNLNVDLKHVNAYARLAELIVAKMEVDAYASQFTKKKRLIDDDMRELVAKMGKWILRGPLTEEEVVIYRGITTSVASAGGDYSEAVAYTIQAMLQSPRFLYRIENQRGDGTTAPVNGYELASRMSYIIWGGPPDQELFNAAENGDLYDLDQVQKQVARMLKDQRAVEQSIRFVDEWLDLYRLDNLRPNKQKFPKWNQQLATDMRAETRSFFKDVVWEQNRPLAVLLNSQLTYLTPQLAEHYGLKASVSGSPKTDLNAIPSRGGLLTQGSVLTVGGDEASMVSRGLFVLQDLLRASVKDPPPCVDTTPVPTLPGKTQRAIAMERLANASCGGCHIKFEPLAFGLEKFDGLGTYHEVDEHGNQLREDGEILFPGDEKPVSYQSSAELMDLLAKSDRVSECLTWKVTQFSLGRPLVPADVNLVKEIHQRASKNGGTWSHLITEIIVSDLVQTTRTEVSE
jgi:hypothetical protein